MSTSRREMSEDPTQAPVEPCAYCGEPAGPGDWANRQWGLVEESGPGGVPVTRYVHARCYLSRLKTRVHPNRPRFGSSR
jgi:hypothetical protein